MEKRVRHPEPLLSEQLAAAIARALRPSRLSRAARKVLRERILERMREPAPTGTRTVHTRQVEWVDILPGVRMKLLRQDLVRGDQTALVEMLPGSGFPPHDHALEEEFFVLEGECFLDGHRMCQGELHTSPAGSRHPRMTSPHGVLVLVRSQILGAAPAA